VRVNEEINSQNAVNKLDLFQIAVCFCEIRSHIIPLGGFRLEFNAKLGRLRIKFVVVERFDKDCSCHHRVNIYIRVTITMLA
jgi:hypothetical protein